MRLATNSIQPYNLRKYRDIAQQLMALGFGTAGNEIASRYDIQNPGSDSLEGQSATHLVLVSKSPDVAKYVKRVEVWISAASGYPVQ